MLVFTTIAEAQRTENFDGWIKIDGNRFKANFDYYTRGKDTIYHGNFEVSRQVQQEEDTYEFISIGGQFLRNNPVKDWTLRIGTFYPTGDGIYKDYSFSYLVNGHEFFATGSFESGSEPAVWNIYDWKIADSKIRDTTLVISMEFRDNIPSGKFEIFEEGRFLTGEIGPEGFAQGTWSSYALRNGVKTKIKEWEFEGNQLVKKTLFKNGKVSTLDLVQSLTANLEIEAVNLDQKYLNIIEIKSIINNPDNYQEYIDEPRVGDLFFSLQDKFNLVDSLSNKIFDHRLSPQVKVNLGKVPFTENEKAYFQSIKNDYSRAESFIETVLSDPQINIASVSNEDVAWYKSVIEAIRDNYLVATGRLIELYDNETIQYLNREKFLSSEFDLDPKVKVSTIVEKDTIIGIYDLDSNYSFLNEGGTALKKLSIFLSLLNEDLAALKEKLSEFIDLYEKEERLVQLENSMLERLETIKHLNDSLINERHDYFAEFDVRATISDFLDKQLSEYSEIPNSEKKVPAVEALIDCINKTEPLILAIQISPENINTINDAYTKKTFNPYTFTDMEEKVKPPIYKAFNNLMMPGIFNNLKALDCKNLPGYTKNFEVLFEGMIDLLKEDTRRTERRVRRVNDAKRAASVLNLDLEF